MPVNCHPITTSTDCLSPPTPTHHLLRSSKQIKNASAISLYPLYKTYINVTINNTPGTLFTATISKEEVIKKEIFFTDHIVPQEVETEQYYNLFQEVLRPLGYDGYFCAKSRSKHVSERDRRRVDGCAVFYKTEK